MALPSLSIDMMTLAACGVGAAVLGIPTLILGSMLNPRQARLTGLAVGLGLAAGIAGAIWVQESPVAVALGFLLLVWCVGWGLRSQVVAQATTRTVRLLANPRFQAALLLALAPMFVLASVYQDEAELTSISDLEVQVDPDPNLITASELFLTDAGEPVPLFQAQANGATLAQAEPSFTNRPHLQMKLIRTAAPTLEYNCHGWVFTGGRFWLRGGAVPTILKDNGYREISDPQPGDLAIWRDHEGAVTHSAVVRLVPSHGAPVLESKWGQLGRYLHGPRDHLYGDEPVYYRSPREGHLLRGLEPAYPAPVRTAQAG